MVDIPAPVRDILETLEAAGHRAWCVGGCVRDALLGRAPEDWDVTTAARPEETMALFGDRAVPTGLRHGTVTVRTAAGGVEVTTLRRDGAYRDHRRPESVTFTDSLEEDLRRRDFTVNALAVDLRGTLQDPLGGRADLAAGILRCVGDPDRRFDEDALRILRGARFAAQLGFAIHPDTAAAIHRNRALLGDIAPERIWTELKKLVTGAHAAEVLRAYPDVIGVFWPEVLPMVGFDQRNRHHCHDVWEHTLHALAAVPPEADLRLTVLLHDIGKPNCFTVDEKGQGHFYGHPAESARLAGEMLRRLRADNATTETVVRLVTWHDKNIPRTRSGVARALGKLGERDLRRLLDVKWADNLAQAPEYRAVQGEIDKAEAILDQLLAEGACVSLRQLAVTGRDLLALGLSGPAVGRILRTLLDAVLDETLPNQRAALLAAARNYKESEERDP
ncbi:MAG TPA: HD domain-containing protein [Candidatus Oscillibacter excrementigallinarum]|uniref:HD domain-containing protein n=1 Tax=Candidatus Oscillibacter excrementigallinarum TaxID=2838716 RepID=A0A9D2LIB1_9FIRM|nr:HD domain-containing protein [Candidatus Oscillibacter excrementigallinarum]